MVLGSLRLLSSRSQNQQYLVRASYLEIYQEEIRDLLSKEPGMSDGLGVGVAVGFALFAWTRSKKPADEPVVAASEPAPAQEDSKQ